MSRKTATATLFGTLFTLHMVAQAQSNVTLYGMLDSGVTYVSNQGGHSNITMADGINGPTIWGLVGSEDIGDGARVVFNLADQFSLNSGSFLPGGSLFTRNAFVGLTNPRYGNFTLGNQYDFMSDSLYASHDDPAIYSGHLYGFSAGPFRKLGIPNNPTGNFDWSRTSQSIANSVKYVSPTFAGISMGAMYGFGNVAGSIGTGNSSSFGLNFTQGAFGANAAYTYIKYPVTSGTVGPQVGIRNWGIGARYQGPSVGASALFVTARNTATGGEVMKGSIGANWFVRPDINLGVSYSYLKGNEQLENNHANETSLIAEYFLSKRSSVYAMAVYQRTNSGAQALINGFTGPTAASSGSSQLVARTGFRTRF
ncbi:porin [Paraburkholderia ferrariae]|uniref:porin n=1 Tax=Paraburkholderia ferrariae TaxID=386056 RepID=UPI0005AAFA2A|nr:porin [Paraburkholderia ferrariae]